MADVTVIESGDDRHQKVYATEVTVDNELITAVNSLNGTIQELLSRLTVLSAVKGVNESIRVTPISSQSTAVTGTLTGVTTVTNLTNFGPAPAREMSDDMNNLMVTLCNINNAPGV